MCGIAGHWSGRGRAEGSRVATALSALQHRGPDGGGLRADPVCVLGHLRLAIHDLTSRGLQPLLDPDENVAVVVNGTIHNAPEIRREEQARGYRFRSASDSEVLIPLYQRHGPDLVHHLRGPFALAVYDRRARRLVLARDRLGQKPLYLASGADEILFSSELGALARTVKTRTFRRDLAAAYLQCGYVPGERSVLAEIGQLAPGSRLVADGDGMRTERYWTPEAVEDRGLDLAASAALLEERLEESVALRTRSERTLGLLLSGGLDSAALMVMAKKTQKEPLTAFTLGFDDRRLDERDEAAETARHLGVEHRSWVFDEEPAPLLERLVRTTGELLADSSWLPTSLLFERASSEATVFLSGEGGDELLLGYDRHTLCAWARSLGPAWLRRGLSRLRHVMPRGHLGDGLAALASGGVPGLLANTAGLLPWPELESLLAPEVRGSPSPLEASFLDLGDLPAHDGRAAALLDLRTYLPSDLLAKGDRAAMAHGVEVWCPFLDHLLVEALLRIPGAVEHRGLRGKRSLRRLLRSRVPRALFHRRKRGFGVPLVSWLTRGSYGRYARTLLGDVKEPFEGVLAGGSALPLLERLQRGDTRLAPLVHAAVVLALWCEEFLR